MQGTDDHPGHRRLYRSYWKTGIQQDPRLGEEITLFALVWVAMLGSVILLKNDGHISVTAFDQWLPKKKLFGFWISFHTYS